jgi:hypothetical protein
MNKITDNNCIGAIAEPRYQRDDTPTIAAISEPPTRTNDLKAVSHISLQQDINHGTADDPTQDSPDGPAIEQPTFEDVT